MTAFGIPSFGIMSFVLISLGLLSFGILSSGLMSVYPDEKCLMVFNCGFMVLQVYDVGDVWLDCRCLIVKRCWLVADSFWVSAYG